MKKRILNPRLASIVATLRHGEMLFIADAGSGVTEKSLYPLSPEVEYLDLGVVTSSPSFQDVVSTLKEAGDFEAAIITDMMEEHNPKDYQFVREMFGSSHLHEVPYIPKFYQLRDRCKAVIQTGDYGAHAQAILIAGYSTELIPMEWLEKGLKEE